MNATDLERSISDSLDQAHVSAQELIAELEGAARMGLGGAALLAKRLRDLLGFYIKAVPLTKVAGQSVVGLGLSDRSVEFTFMDAIRAEAGELVARKEDQEERDFVADCRDRGAI